MLESKNIHIFGYSGHAYVVIDVALSNNYIVKSYFDKFELKKNPYNLIYNGFENEVNVKSIVKDDVTFPAIGSNLIRKKVVDLIEKSDLNQTTLIHSSASVSFKSNIKESTLIASNSIINSMVFVGKGTIVNSGAILEHECKIGSFSHIAPGAVLAGNVKVGENVFIGANSTIKEGIVIGNNVLIGAGSVVICDVPSNETWVGNPARRIK